jgi:RNA polymerase sigma factor (sigma-70 family)
MSMSSECDEKLISKIVEKDEDAFVEFVRRYQSRILNLCFKLTANRESAEEAAQEVFLQVYREARQFRGLSKVSTWVCRIAVNRSLNICRKVNRQGWMGNFRSLLKNGIPGSDEFPAPPQYSPDEFLEHKQEREFLKKALNTLPEKQKIAFLLRHAEGLSYQEIAEILNTSVASVESRIHRAKDRLRKKLLSRLRNC